MCTICGAKRKQTGVSAAAARVADARKLSRTEENALIDPTLGKTSATEIEIEIENADCR